MSNIVTIGAFRTCMCPECANIICLWETDNDGSVIKCSRCNTLIKLKAMFELEENLIKLIAWVQDTYGCSKKEAITSIENKLNSLK